MALGACVCVRLCGNGRSSTSDARPLPIQRSLAQHMSQECLLGTMPVDRTPWALAAHEGFRAGRAIRVPSGRGHTMILPTAPPRVGQAARGNKNSELREKGHRVDLRRENAPYTPEPCPQTFGGRGHLMPSERRRTGSTQTLGKRGHLMPSERRRTGSTANPWEERPAEIIGKRDT